MTTLLYYKSCTSSDSPGCYVPPMNHYRKSACQRHTLYVSFRSLGWQDIKQLTN
ncbi:hypothetical protein DPMN_047061 [Dreissena polymorpha]|uniref:Uncharacterized protein n=1 Tax=Dreissena polymorpha TaxID=45954 RepID=A0A9D4D730_DREPO|nr:hypothetical protein DPMN_047061 [Dreissena polymorpha]